MPSPGFGGLLDWSGILDGQRRSASSFVIVGTAEGRRRGACSLGAFEFRVHSLSRNAGLVHER